MRFFLPLFFALFWFGNYSTYGQLSISASPVSGCDTLVVQFSLVPASGTDTIQSVEWDFGNGFTSSGNLTPIIEYNTPGVYNVTCLINGVTTLTFNNQIRVRQGPLAVFSVTDTIGFGPLSKFFSAAPQPVPGNTYTYNWEFSDGNSYFSPSFIHSFTETGAYQLTLTITDQTGCFDVGVSHVVAGNLIEVPNVFSPNNDDINDYLLIRTNGINVFSLEIFTRSGVLVYKTVSPYLIWDGRSMSGHEMSPGIYYYVIKQVDGGAGLTKNGFVHLMK